MAVRYITKGKSYKQIAKDQSCIACAGSGYYDDHGSPKCSSCNGTGIDPAYRR